MGCTYFETPGVFSGHPVYLCVSKGERERERERESERDVLMSFIYSVN